MVKDEKVTSLKYSLVCSALMEHIKKMVGEFMDRDKHQLIYFYMDKSAKDTQALVHWPRTPGRNLHQGAISSIIVSIF